VAVSAVLLTFRAEPGPASRVNLRWKGPLSRVLDQNEVAPKRAPKRALKECPGVDLGASWEIFRVDSGVAPGPALRIDLSMTCLLKYI